MVLRLVLLLFVVVCGVFSAQNIKHLSVDEGLPQSFVSALLQDNDGFVWISTRNGLARYDGNTIKNFRHNFRNKNSIASNIIDQMKKGRGNSFWIKYGTGEIDHFDVKSQKIQHIINVQFSEENNVDLHRNVWLVSDSVLWFKTKNNRLYSYDLRKKSRPVFRGENFGHTENICNILEDSNKNVWILTPKKLRKFDAKTQSFLETDIPYPDFSDNNSGKIAETTIFSERKNGEFLWADNTNLYFYNPQTQKFRKEKLPASLLYNIKFIDKDAKGKEYFMAGNSIYRYDLFNGLKEVSKIKLDKGRQPQAFMVDNSGLIWVGGDAEGVYMVDTSLNFESFQYKNDFVVDLLKNVYGISAYDFFGWKNEKGILPPSYFFKSFWHQRKNWLALNRTVCYFDVSKQKIFRLPELPKTGSFSPIMGMTLNNGFPIVIDQYGQLYFFDKISWRKLFSFKKQFPNLKVTEIYLDEKTKILYILTENHGLLTLNLSTKNIVNIRQNSAGLPTNHLISLMPDKNKKDILWIGSNNGLIEFNKKSTGIKIFSVEDLLPDNVIYSLLSDKNGNLWMGTNKGLIKFDTKTFKSRVFTRHHGLENIEFNRFHKFLLPDGKMAFGGSSNGIKFYPDSIADDNFSPATAITGISLNNQNISLSEPEILPVNQLQNLGVDYFENTISISFAALQFNQPQEIQYRYRLKGYQDEWVSIGNNHEAVFTKVPPGNYVFEVNSSNTSGKWSNKIKSLAIKVYPPLWKTWWAILIYIIFLIGGIIWYIKFRIKQEIIKNDIKLKQKEANELRRLDKIKTKFFANIAHEFRTPLSLIIGPAEQLKVSDSVQNREMLFDTIKKNTDSLIQLTDQLIDVAKLEAGVLQPYFVWGDIVPVISHIVKAFSDIATEKGVTLSLEVPEKAEFLFSVNTLDRILYNLIANAIKFCKEGDSVTVKVRNDETGIFIQVTDTGAGIPEEEQKNIFKRYFKGSNQHQLQGNGIGLTLVKELVDLHQGTIELKSSTKIPSGTTFLVWLPFESQHIKFPENIENPQKTGEKPVVMIVEDNKELARFISDNLNVSYQVLNAENGKKALEVIQHTMPEIIVSDVAMDEMDGFEFCRALKTDVTINHIPVILLTAKADIESRLQGLSFGANDYIAKPFSILELKLRIENLLKLQKKQQQYFQHQFSAGIVKEDNDKNVTIDNLNQEFLNKIYKIIDENLDDSNFGVEELASAFSMSRTSLHRKAKAMFNIPAGEIIKIYRLKKAAELLKKNYNISEVAYMTGFNTPSYFTKCFKEYFGKTPTKYH